VHYWSYSKMALGWIGGDSNRLKLFVSNQAVKIRATAAQGSWRTENPADLASRGAPAGQQVNSQLWWNGQAWMKTEEQHWQRELDISDAATTE
jgi:hypothetical protein